MTKVASKSAQIITKFFNFRSKATTAKSTAAISALLSYTPEKNRHYII
jgi:hypothetical protein